MNLDKINFINYNKSIDFINYCRQRTLEEGCIIIKNLQHSELISFLDCFGKVVPQHDGNSTFDVKFSEELGKIYYSRTNSIVPPHTDGHDMKIPPHFFFLYCVSPSESNDGFTEVSSSTDIFKDFTDDEMEILCNHKFDFITKPSSQIMNAPKVESSIYDAENNIFRYSYNYLSKQSDNVNIKKIIDKIKEKHEKNKIPIFLKRNELLICENHHILHSRSSFSGAKRHLIRAWVD